MSAWDWQGAVRQLLAVQFQKTRWLLINSWMPGRGCSPLEGNSLDGRLYHAIDACRSENALTAISLKWVGLDIVFTKQAASYPLRNVWRAA